MVDRQNNPMPLHVLKLLLEYKVAVYEWALYKKLSADTLKKMDEYEEDARLWGYRSSDYEKERTEALKKELITLIEKELNGE